MQTYSGRTDMTKLIVAFSTFENGPKNKIRASGNIRPAHNSTPSTYNRNIQHRNIKYPIPRQGTERVKYSLYLPETLL
jgi:hypothetical protein